MTCWEILGIEPTGDHQRIRQAYEQQMKFASDEEAERLQTAYREATGGVSVSSDDAWVARSEPRPAPSDSTMPEGPESSPSGGVALNAVDEQVVREVIIQVKALLNDQGRTRDVGIWKAILCEPPADQSDIRRVIGDRLESQVRPLAENGNFPAEVARFIGDWFGWFSLAEAEDHADGQSSGEDEFVAEENAAPPQMANFWPAVIGWIVALVVLTSLFGGMGGGG